MGSFSDWDRSIWRGARLNKPARISVASWADGAAVASLLIVRADLDVSFTALTASIFCCGYLVGVVIANTRPRFFTRH